MINLLLQLIRKNIDGIVKYSTVFWASHRVLQAPVVQLLHIKTNKIIELPVNFSLLKIGKISNKNIPDIDLSNFPYHELVSRNHAQFCFDGKDYFIPDIDSSKVIYKNKSLILTGI